MQVVHVAPTSFGPDGLLGGGERYPLELARALARHVETELVTFGPVPSRTVDEAGLLVRVLRPVTHLRHPAHPVAPALVAAVRGADVVHTHHLRSAPSRIAALTARAGRQRAVVTDHGLQGGTWGGLLPRLFDLFLTVSAFSARELGAPPARTRVIFGGADPQRFYRDPAVARRGVLFVGRVTPHKGIDRLIRALPEGAPLSIVGSAGHDPRPPERDYPLLLRRLSEGRDVRFVGPLSDDDLAAAYRAAAVVVLPSVDVTCYGRRVAVSELLGLVLIEAMASGTPVVASRIGGLPEVVADGETGFLVEPGNVEELRERLQQLLADRPLAARMAGRARDVARERFTWEACAQRCLAAYEEVHTAAE